MTTLAYIAIYLLAVILITECTREFLNHKADKAQRKAIAVAAAALLEQRMLLRCTGEPLPGDSPYKDAQGLNLVR